MAKIDEYRLYRLINGDEMSEYTNSEQFKTELGEMVMSNSLSTYRSMEEDDDILIVECL